MPLEILMRVVDTANPGESRTVRLRRDDSLPSATWTATEAVDGPKRSGRGGTMEAAITAMLRATPTEVI